MEISVLLGSFRIAGLASLIAMNENEFDFVEAGRALRRYFQSSGLPEPEDAAQEAIARMVEKRLEKPLDNPEAYLKGIARNIVREHFKSQKPQILLPGAPPDHFNERLLQCLERCEKKLLNQAERKLLHDWYRSEGSEKLRDRRHLAEAEGISPETLKTRVYRLRQKIAPCVRKCRDAIEDS